MTPKQEMFVREYLVDLNATQAAIRAGYSEKTAYSAGQRLLKDVEVAQLISAAKVERAEEVGVDARWVLRRLADEAEADVADIYDENGHLKAIHDWPLIWRKGLIAGIETVREKVGESKDGEPEYSTVYKIKISDRVKRLELIGKHVDVSAFMERIEHSMTDDMAAILNSARQAAA